MATTSTQDLDGIYKTTFAPEIESLVPACAVLYDTIPFAKKELANGSYFIQPVVLSQEQGWTYYASDASAPALSGSVSMATKPAQVMGANMAGQSQLTVEAAERARTKGPSAFDDVIGLQMRNMKESGVKRLEINFLYGQTSLAVAHTSANVSTTSTAITIKLSEWAAGFWSGMKNAKFDLYQSGVYGSQTKINANAALVVSTVNTATRVVTVTGNATDIGAVDTYIAAHNDTAELYFAGAYGVEAAGLKRQLTNQASLFNIDASVYDLWLGNTYSVVSPYIFSFAQMNKAITAAVNRGLDEDIDVLVSPDAWTNLMTDQAALRMYTQGGGTFENGANKLSFAGQSGKITIRPHIFVKQGDAFIVPLGNVKRIGATDLTFNIPGTDGGKVFIQLQSTMAFEYRCYSHQTIFFDTPAKGVYVNTIVN